MMGGWRLVIVMMEKINLRGLNRGLNQGTKRVAAIVATAGRLLPVVSIRPMAESRITV